MKKIFEVLCLVWFSIFVCSIGINVENNDQPAVLTEVVETTVVKMSVNNGTPPNLIECNLLTQDIISEEEIELIALMAIAEAEGESELGQRLVIDVILNRYDDERFPDTINGVIYQPNQFSSVSNGRTNRCTVTDYFRNLVRDEIYSRTNTDVIFFRTCRYSSYGEPLFIEGEHYFSKY